MWRCRQRSMLLDMWPQKPSGRRSGASPQTRSEVGMAAFRVMSASTQIKDTPGGRHVASNKLLESLTEVHIRIRP